MRAHLKMRTLPCLLGIAASFFLSQASGHAADSTRLLVTVSKKTIGRVPDKVVGGADRNRKQTLAVSVTNQSSRAVPVGVIQWTAVIRKYSGSALKYAGKMDVPALLSFKSAEVSCGAFDVATYQSLSGLESDRVDYEIAILHDGKETYRMASASNFDALAEKAVAMTTEDAAVENGENNQDPPRLGRRRDRMAAEPAAIGTDKMPPQKTNVPVAEIVPPGAATTVPPPPPVPQQTFDFFNLRGKRAPEAK